MPTPNRYMGNGKRYPNGSLSPCKRFIMVHGSWKHRAGFVKEPVEGTKEHRNMLKTVTRIMLVIVVVAFLAALCTGCTVNVVNINNADIGVQTVMEAMSHE